MAIHTERIVMGTMKDNMHIGALYLPNDEEIMNEQIQCLEKLYDFNSTRPLEMEKGQLC